MVSEREWPTYSLEEVRKHWRKDDAWIVVNDRVYDMTHHVQQHEGWHQGGKQSTLITILSAMGTDCTDDFLEVHSAKAMMMLRAFQIGVLDKPNTGCKRVTFRTFEELEAMGAV